LIRARSWQFRPAHRKPSCVTGTNENDATAAVLNSLLALDQPPEIIAGELSRFAWDVDSPLVTLTSTHAEAVLQRFVRSTLSKEDVERWANLLESREDAALALEHETVLRLLVFELANPKITRELTREVAAEWIRELRAPSTPSR
jgi:hypothetical protein